MASRLLLRRCWWNFVQWRRGSDPGARRPVTCTRVLASALAACLPVDSISSLTSSETCPMPWATRHRREQTEPSDQELLPELLSDLARANRYFCSCDFYLNGCGGPWPVSGCFLMNSWQDGDRLSMGRISKPKGNHVHKTFFSDHSLRPWPARLGGASPELFAMAE